MRKPDIYLSVPHHLTLPSFSASFRFPHLGVGSNVGVADIPPPPPPPMALIQCQPSDIIPRWHRLVSGAPSADWQALEVVNCRSPPFRQPARWHIQTDTSVRSNDSSLLLEMIEARHRDLYQSGNVCGRTCASAGSHRSLRWEEETHDMSTTANAV